MVETPVSITESPEHLAADIKKLVIDPDNIIKTMKQNYRDRPHRRSHNLKSLSPFTGKKKLSLHTDTGGRYPPEHDPKAIHLKLETFLAGHNFTRNQRDWQTTKSEFSNPDRSRVRRLYDEEEEDTDEDWGVWWDTAVEVWESNVRAVLKDEITLAHRTEKHGMFETTIPVGYTGK